MLRIATVNVNGIRAAWRKGMPGWLDACDADVVTLQEVRAPDEIVHEILDGTGYPTSSTPKPRPKVAPVSP